MHPLISQVRCFFVHYLILHPLENLSRFAPVLNGRKPSFISYYERAYHHLLWNIVEASVDFPTCWWNMGRWWLWTKASKHNNETSRQLLHAALRISGRYDREVRTVLVLLTLKIVFFFFFSYFFRSSLLVASSFPKNPYLFLLLLFTMLFLSVYAFLIFFFPFFQICEFH